MIANNIWLIGTGPMAVEYAKVLKALHVNFTVIGRGESNCIKFKEATGIVPLAGGLGRFLGQKPVHPEAVINSVGIEMLSSTTAELINAGVKNILLEKPGVGHAGEIYPLADAVRKMNVSLLLAYNRRFYAAVSKAREIIKEDGGVRSFNFEFTEWSHVIEKLVPVKTETELQNWFLGNSTHVIDLAFFLGGNPKEISCFHEGKNRIKWHTRSSVFAGAGVAENGALFSYQANWQSPGRFVVEILTPKHRLIFRPLEKLQIQENGSVAINPVEGIDYYKDEQFKPGVYEQTRSFLAGEYADFCSIFDQEKMMRIYEKMRSTQ